MKSPTVNRSTFESLEPRLMLSVSPDLLAASQPLQSTPVGSISVNGTIDTPDHADLYQYTAEATGRLQVNMQGTGGLDSYLEMFDDRGRRIRRNDNAWRDTTDSMVSLGIRAGRTYYIRASGKGTSGNYDLTISSFPRDDYGNTLDTAGNLRIDGRGWGSRGGKINYGQDVDMLAFVARQTGTLEARMQVKGMNATLVPDLVIYDAYGNELTATAVAADGATSTFTAEVSAGQTYYVRAVSGDKTQGRYRIRVANRGKPVDPPSPQPPPFSLVIPDNLTPGASILAQVVSLGGGEELVIAGTDQADTITVAQSGDTLVVTTLTTSQSFSGVSGVVIAGFGGDDRIRVTNTATAAVWADAGAGNDSLFVAGSGTAMLLGGLGDDLMVAVGGGATALYGQDGLDSFWCDAVDTVADASASENAVGAVHAIAGFYQPYTTNPQAPEYVPTTIAGQNLVDPQITPYATRYANFSSVPLFVGGPQYTDISQGAVGDCYYMASLASLASADPQVIRQAVTELGDGTYAVRFYRAGQVQYLRVDGDLPVNSGGYLSYADLGRDGELWAPILEKAYAYFRYGQNSYASLNGGWMEIVYEEITNAQAYTQWTTSTDALYSLLDRTLAGGHAATLASRYDASSPIVGSHAYMVQSVQTVGGVKTVTVYNPWGVDGRGSDGNPNDGLINLTIGQVAQFFAAVVSSAV